MQPNLPYFVHPTWAYLVAIANRPSLRIKHNAKQYNTTSQITPVRTHP